MAPRVFVTYAREAGPADARRLTADLERHLGAQSVLGTAGEDADHDVERIERSEALVAVIGPSWQARDDAFAAELEHAFTYRVPVIAVLTRKAQMPPPQALADTLRPLLDNHPRLTLEIPSDFYWDVVVSHLASWLRAIGDETERLRKAREDAAARGVRLERDLERTQTRLREAETAASSAERRIGDLDRAVQKAKATVAERAGRIDAGRLGPGLRVYVSYRPETGGDVRTLERDLRDRVEGGRLSSSEPIPVSADPTTIIAERIARADALLAIIGPTWASSGDSGGVRRLDDPRDPVRLELAAAFERGIPVIPVLTQHAHRPAASALPQSLAALAEQPAYELLVPFWNDGIDDLVARLSEIERELRAREKARDDALTAQRRLERDAEAARGEHSRAVAATRAARDRIARFEEELRRTRDEVERLSAEHPDQNRAFLDGPGPIEVDGKRRGARASTALNVQRPPRAMLAGIALIVFIVIIVIVASH